MNASDVQATLDDAIALTGVDNAAMRDFVSYYNNKRYHESLNTVTPADVYFGRDAEVLSERERIKRRTTKLRKKECRAALAA